MFRWTPAAFEKYVIDHREIHEECERKYGKPLEMAYKSTYNPKTKKYFGFSPGYMPVLISYRKDLWDEAGFFPGSWDDIHSGGQKIFNKNGKSTGIGLYKTDYALNGLMYSFGASVQDEAGNLVLNSKETIDAVRYVKTLYQDSSDKMLPHFLQQNLLRDYMVSGDFSLVFETNIASRTAEKNSPEISDKIHLAKAPKGPIRQMGSNIMATYLIWKFSENIEGAKKFLIDYVGNFQKAFLGSGFLYFPCFPKSVPDMKQLLKDDPRGHPPTKYSVLEDVAEWTTNIGYPGYANAAMAEIFDSSVVSDMFRRYAGDYLSSAEEAVEQAEEQCKQIYKRWEEKGLV